MSHTTIYVLDQDQARDFYVGKLGFEVKVDQSLPSDFRWLTVAPKGLADLEIILLKVGSTGKADPKDLDSMIALLKKGMSNAGAFHTADCRRTFEELKARGVEFVSEPKDQF